MRLIAKSLCVALVALATFGCGGDDTPPISGPVTLQVATEPHGGSFRARFDGLNPANQDFGN